MLARYKLEREERARSDKAGKKRRASNKTSGSESSIADTKRRKAENALKRKKVKEKWEEGSTSSANHKKLRGENEPESLAPEPAVVVPEDKSETVSLNLSDRPIRAAAATAQAISEAQQEFLSIEPPPEFKRNKRGEIEVLVDKPVKPRKYYRKAKHASNASTESEKDTAEEEEISRYVSEMTERFKSQFLSMLHTMQEPIFRRNVEIEIIGEQRRQEELVRRVGQLESQIEGLVQESLEMLKYVLKLLGIEASNPAEFIEKAKEIVCNHNELQHRRHVLETEVLQLQEEQRLILREKEKQLIESVLLHRASLHLSEPEVLRLVQTELRACSSLAPAEAPVSVDVTLTRVGQVNSLNDNNNNYEESRSFSLSKYDSDTEPAGFRNTNAAVLDHINREIERNMRRTDTVSSLPQPTNSISSRLEQVIEDSVRGSQTSPKQTVVHNEGLVSCLEANIPKENTTNVSDEREEGHDGEEELKTEERVKWQEEMTSGFDRLVALANQADLRRRSVDSNSQGRTPSNSEPTPAQSAELTNIQTEQRKSSPSSDTNVAINPSGERGPERHFKKRYFDQERRQQEQIKLNT